jgi:hypothetical protein
MEILVFCVKIFVLLTVWSAFNAECKVVTDKENVQTPDLFLIVYYFASFLTIAYFVVH